MGFGALRCDGNQRRAHWSRATLRSSGGFGRVWDQQFVIAAANPGQLRADFTSSTNDAVVGSSSQPYALIYPGTNGLWAVTADELDAVYTWTFTNGPATGDMAVLIVSSNGFGKSFHSDGSKAGAAHSPLPFRFERSNDEFASGHQRRWND